MPLSVVVLHVCGCCWGMVSGSRYVCEGGSECPCAAPPSRTLLKTEAVCDGPQLSAFVVLMESGGGGLVASPVSGRGGLTPSDAWPCRQQHLRSIQCITVGLASLFTFTVWSERVDQFIHAGVTHPLKATNWSLVQNRTAAGL